MLSRGRLGVAASVGAVSGGVGGVDWAGSASGCLPVYPGGASDGLAVVTSRAMHLPRPSELGRVQELGHVWAGGLRCPTASAHAIDAGARTVLVCTPEQPLLPGLAEVQVHLPGSDGGSGGRSGGAVTVSSDDPAACELVLRELASGQSIAGAPSDPGMVLCVAVGMQGALRLQSGSSWPASVGAGETLVMDVQGAGWGSGGGWHAGALAPVDRHGSMGGLIDRWTQLEAAVVSPLRQEVTGTLGVYPCDGNLTAGSMGSSLQCTAPAGMVGGPASLSVHLPGLSWLDTASIVVEDSGSEPTDNATQLQPAWVDLPPPVVQAVEPPSVDATALIESEVSGTKYNLTLRGTSLVTPDMQVHVGAVYLGGQRCDPLVVHSATELRCSVLPHMMESDEVRVLSRSLGVVNAALEAGGAARAQRHAREWRQLSSDPREGFEAGVWDSNVDPPHVVEWTSNQLIARVNPRVLGSNPSLVSPRGGQVVQLVGIQLGALGGGLIDRIDVDGAPCANMSVESDFVVQCTLTPSPGAEGVVSVHTPWGKVYPSSAGVVRFLSPEIESVVVDPDTIFNDLGSSYRVTVRGQHFGSARTGGNGTSPRMVISGKECPVVRVLSDSEMECEDIGPEWTPGDFSVRVLLSGREAVAPTAFQFQPPVQVQAASPESADGVPEGRVSGDGGWIVIEGNGLGNSVDTIDRVRVGPYTCTQLEMLAPATRLRCLLPPGVGTGHRVQVVSVRNGENSIDTAPAVDYAAPVITRATFAGGPDPGMAGVGPVASTNGSDAGDSSSSSSSTYPRAAAYLLESGLELLLDVTHAGASLTQWDGVTSDGAGVIRLDGQGWNASCTNATVRGTRASETSPQESVIAMVQCTVVDWRAASAAASGQSSEDALQLVSVHFSVGGQSATGQLEDEVQESSLLQAESSPGGTVLLVGRPVVQVLSPRLFPSNGSADAVLAGAARRAQVALGSATTAEQELDALLERAGVGAAAASSGRASVVLDAGDVG